MPGAHRRRRLTQHALAHLVRDTADRRAGPAGGAVRRGAGALEMAYQPIVDMATLLPIAYEALVRSGRPEWRCRALIDAAEQLGRMVELDGRCVGRSRPCSSPTPPSPAVRQRPPPRPHGSRAGRLLLATLAVAHRVVLEVTERASLAAIQGLPQLLETRAASVFAWRWMTSGRALQLDGLRLAAAEVVKIDRELVRDLPTDPVRVQIVRAATALAHALEMKSWPRASSCDRAGGGGRSVATTRRATARASAAHAPSAKPRLRRDGLASGRCSPYIAGRYAVSSGRDPHLVLANRQRYSGIRQSPPLVTTPSGDGAFWYGS